MYIYIYIHLYIYIYISSRLGSRDPGAFGQRPHLGEVLAVRHPESELFPELLIVVYPSNIQ